MLYTETCSEWIIVHGSLQYGGIDPFHAVHVQSGFNALGTVENDAATRSSSSIYNDGLSSEAKRESCHCGGISRLD